MKAKRLVGRSRPWLALLAVGTFAFGLTLEGAPSDKTKRDTARGEVRAPRAGAAIPGESAQLRAPRSATLRESFEADNSASDPHRGLTVFRSGRVNFKNLPIAPTVRVNPYTDEASNLRREGKLAPGEPWRPRRQNATVAGVVCPGNTCTFDIDCDDCLDCTVDRCLINPELGDGTCDGVCDHQDTADGQGFELCSDGEFCNGRETCQGQICEDPGEGTGIEPDIDDLLPCEGVCAGGPRSSQRCECPGGICPLRLCSGGTEDGELCSPPATACTDGGGVCDPTACVGGTNDGGACNLSCVADSGGTCSGGTRDTLPCGDNAQCPGGGSCSGAPVSGDCLAAICDEEVTNDCVVPCTQPICDANSGNAESPCTSNADCLGGDCLGCGPNGTCGDGDDDFDEVCADGLMCNGDETCNVGTGLCEEGTEPCGPGGLCTEKTCQNLQKTACLDDTDCAQAQACVVQAGIPGCYYGRCCTGPGPELDCSRKRFADCQGAEQTWFAPEGGFRLLASGDCPAGGIDQPTVSCPKYSSGVLNAAAEDGVLIFPVSDASCEGLDEIGDDWQFSNASFIELNELRFAGGVETVLEERITFEFYDTGGNLIEDIFFVSGSGMAVRTVEIKPPITIPSTGRVVARVASAFAPNGRLMWLTTDVTDVGSNDITSMWANGATVSNWLKECIGGPNDGGWCNPALTGSDCASPGVCTDIPHVLTFELAGEKVPDPVGACCKDVDVAGIAPSCDGDVSWTCRASGGSFLGALTDCSQCSAGSDNAFLPCRTCSDDATQECVRNSDCTSNSCIDNNDACDICVGGANDGQSCNNGCPGGTCSGTGVCEASALCAVGACCNPTTGACTPGTTPDTQGGTCPLADFQGYGTDCVPDCCAQPLADYTGADDCENVIVHVVNLPALPDAYTKTISGNNSTASLPDTCTAGNFDIEENNPDDVDLGWWEGFSLSECAFVRLDLCCSDPLHAPQWVIMWDGCPCEGSGVKQWFNVENPNEPDLPENNRGDPFCDGDNLWWQYGPLPAGTYYQPIFSALAGARGDYQLHITAKACPKAACCYLECVGGTEGGQGCSRDASAGGTDCPGGSCDVFCELLNILDCENSRGQGGKGGYFQGPPNRPTGVTDGCPGTACDTGSCCPSPGVCVDDVQGNPVGKDDCDTQNGIYVGGLRCFGGTCNGGDRDGLTCFDIDDCPNATACSIDEQQSTLPSPCPICELANQDAFCQIAKELNGARLSDECVGDCVAEPENGRTVVADDFVADVTGDITTICILGIWFDQADGGDCSDQNPPVDEPGFWTVRLHADGGAVGGVPGTILAERTLTKIAGGVEFDDGGRNNMRYQFSVDGAPMSVVSGTTYWLSVSADTAGQNGTTAECDWMWDFADVGDGNEFSYQDNGNNVYTVEDALNVDMAFCLDIANSTPDPVERACCACTPSGVTAGTDPNCEVTTFRDCDLRIDGEFFIDQLECLAFTCPNSDGPGNDACIDADVVGCGADLIFSTFCAGSSPPPLDLVQCGGAQPTNFDRDAWWFFTPGAGEAGDTTISLCDPDFEPFDEIMAIYTDGTANCVCPTDASTQNQCSDDDCVFTGAGSEVQIVTTENVCYTIRVGGFENADGRGHLTITCGSPTPGAPLPGDDVCDQGTNPGATCSRDADCTGGGTCGSKSRYITIKPDPGNTSATSIKVTILSNPVDPTTETQSWFAGAEGTVANPPNAALTGALLECNPGTPNSEVWSNGNLNLYGPMIVPGALYEVSQCDPTGTACSPALVVGTGKWGDVVTPFGGGSQPNFGDISSVVDKFRNLGSAPDMPRSDLVGPGNPGNPNTANQGVNFGDISADVDAFRGFTYPFTVPQCP